MQNKCGYKKVCVSVLSNLTDKQKKVLEKRFGLTSGKKETLQTIGDGFGITRERVRQIENEGFTKLQKIDFDNEVNQVLADFATNLKKSGGLQREDILLKELNLAPDGQNQAIFLLTLGKDFYRFNDSDNCFSYWALSEEIGKDVEKTLSNVLAQFKKINSPLRENVVFKFVSNASPKFVLSAIEVSKHIGKGPLGEYGLVSWPEIKPKGVRDAAFLALKSNQKPLHFRDVATLATSLTNGFYNRKEVLPQTVHNELIRDKRFILVGRGMYALKEWGYISGTVKQVIATVLEQSKTPLNRNEILSAVQKQRLVKDNTVFLNLSDKKRFAKIGGGRYTIYSS